MNSPTSNRRTRPRLRRIAGGALGSLMALGALGIVLDAAATPATFPAVNQWVAVTLGNVPVFDPVGDTQGSRDIVGNSDFPMLYVSSDATHIYFRLRVNSDPLQNATNFAPFGWGCFIDIDDNPQTYEFSTVIDGVNNPDLIQLFQNTVTTTLNDPNDEPDLPALESLQAPLTPAIGHARVSLADDGDPLVPDSNFGNNPDFFIDWAFERNVAEAAGFNPTQTARYYCGSSNNGRTIAADCSGSATTDCPLDSQFSDPITCGPSGCAICGNGVTTGNEGCDDGNLVDGDGCSSSCLIELGEPCTTSPGCESGFCDPAGNICACDADGDCPSGDVCSTLSNPNACVECVSDAQCTSPALSSCDILTNSCVECVLDSDCPGGLVCDDPTNTCVQCVDDADCPGGVCNTTTNTCTGCLDDGDCPGDSVCDEPLSTCVECMLDVDCDFDPGLPVCKTFASSSQNACVQCVVDANCTDPSAPTCDATTNTCVQCVDDGDCTSGTCDTTTKLCVECLDNADCTDPTVPACKVDQANSSNNDCVECLENTDCGMGFVCNQAINQCVQCNNDANCVALDPAVPTCDLTTSTCVVCLDDLDCATNSPTTPTCMIGATPSANVCVECVDGGDCASGVCNTANNTCVECLADADCTSGTCDTSINECVACLDDGDCAAPTPFCELATPSTNNACVECLVDANCTAPNLCNLTSNTCEPPCTVDEDCAGNLVCDPTTTVCVECVDDGDCANGTCDTAANVCVACLDDGDCSAPTPACKVDATDNTNNVCVECVDDGDCLSGVCDTTNNTCVGCLGDADCTSGVCDENIQTCVECLVNTDCPEAEPVCKLGDSSPDNTCVECTQDSDCESDNCETSTNTCGEPPQTGCDSDAECSIGQVCEARACIDGCRLDGSGNGCPSEQQCVEIAAGNPIGRCETPVVEEETGFFLEGGGCSCRAAGSTDAGQSDGLPVALFGLAVGGALLRRRRQG